MNKIYEEIKTKALSAMRGLARECPSYEDAKMLIASSETAVSLKRNKVHKRIDSEWVEKIEATIPYIDTIVRNPSIMIEDVDEILPVEISRHITDKSIKHLAQHTNLILDVKGDEVTPSKILNVYHDETLLTYENKFVNTLVARLSAFVDKRYKALKGGSGTEANFRFDYQTEFEHFTSSNDGRNIAKVNLQIELTSPSGVESTEADLELNDAYKALLARVERISNAITSFQSSAFIQSLKRNYIRPPVIRTNAILKNKNMKECLNLWEYIESFDKVGYSFVGDEYREMPSDDYISSLHPAVALQYTTFYHGVVENAEENRLLTEKHLFETFPEFDDELNLEELEDYLVYDSEYKKTVPVSRLMNNRKKLSEDEKRIHAAIIVSLKADEILNAEQIQKEAEARRLAREARLREEEERRRREEEERARRKAELDALRQTVEIRYRRSYMSRLIQSGDLIQGFYNEIKNELLSYQGVKARTSWSKETFKKGRQPVARIDIKGKMLYLYLALDPALCEERYRVVDCSEKSGGDEYPSLLKVKSERGKKYAFELIKLLMEKLALPRIERETEDFRLPYEDDDALIERGLIKVVLPSGVTLDENTDLIKKDISGLFDELEDGEKPAEEQPAPEKTSIEVRYRRSFTSRYIQAERFLQDYYTDIKNALLSYKGVKARTSWSKETFKRGRVPFARIDIKGKMLYLYLALDPASVDQKYRLVDRTGKSGGDEYPSLLKVKSERGRKYALELIAILASRLGFEAIERADEDFRLPYEEDEPLIERGLIKVIVPGGASLDENSETVKADISNLFENTKDGGAQQSDAEKSDESGEEEAVAASAEAVESTEAESEESDEEEESSAIITADGTRIEVRYRRSFTSRLIQSGETVQGYYAIIKNELLSYKGVKSRISWPRETFRRGRQPVARIDIRGKTLRLFLALDPNAIEEKYHVKDVSEKSFGKDFPSLLKVRSDRGVKYALELIALLFEKLALPRIERNAEDYSLPYEEDAPLIERGLIKVVLPNGVTDVDGAELVKADLSSVIGAPAEEVAAEPETEVEAAKPEVSEPEAEVEAAKPEVSEPEAEVEAAKPEVSEPEAEVEAAKPEVSEPEAEVEAAKPEAAEPETEAETTEAEAEEDDNAEYEGAVEAAIAEIAEEDVLERKLDEILTSSDENKWMAILSALGSPVVSRKKYSESRELSHAFSDSKHAATASVVIPYTRAQYLALPRKKKKSVLTIVRKMVDYNTTKKLLDALKLRKSENPRILERIERLEARLAEEAKSLPIAKLWEESVKRLKR